MTSREAAGLVGQVMDRSKVEPGEGQPGHHYQAVRHGALCGGRQLPHAVRASRIPKQGRSIRGDNYTFVESQGSQVVMSLSDGMGSGEQADRESRQVVELTEQLLEAGFSARSALKLVNTVLLLAGREQHPATLDLSCIDLHTGVLESMKLGPCRPLSSARTAWKHWRPGRCPWE